MLRLALAAAVMLLVATALFLSRAAKVVEISCDPCYQRNTTIRIVADEDFDYYVVSASYNGTERARFSCNSTSCFTDQLKKPGNYTISASLIKSGKEVARASAALSILPSPQIPEFLGSAAMYRMGEPVLGKPLSGARITSVEYSKEIEVLSCDGECVVRHVRAPSGMTYAILRVDGNARTAEEGSRSGDAWALLGMSSSTTYTISLLDEWDNEYQPLYPRANGTSMEYVNGSIVFEIPEGERAAFLVGRKHAKGVAFFLIPVRRSEIMFFVDLREGSGE